MGLLSETIMICIGKQMRSFVEQDFKVILYNIRWNFKYWL